jgi:sigma-B regulation protein RsbU (phosphoserine phosphatase)
MTRPGRSGSDELSGRQPSDLYDRSPCGLLSTRADGTILTINATLSAWLGRDRHELIGRRRFVDLLSVGDRIYHETHYAPLLSMQGSISGIAMELRTADGTRIPVLVASRMQPGADGDEPVIHTAVFEARDRRGYERELLRARENADRERDRAQQLARVLQRSLLPPRLPALPGITTAAHYHPASADEVGGDFYDLFPLPGDRWGFFLGDVCGKGPEAAALTSLARYTLRSTATYEHDPAALLQTLNAVLRQEEDDAAFAQCTVVVGTLRAHQDRVTVQLASAGHPLPLLLGGDGTARYLDLTGGQVMGALDDPSIAVTTLELGPGDTLILYSDGLTEARIDADRNRYEEQRLLDFATALAPSSAAAAIESIRNLITGFGDGVDDDVAVLALGVPLTSNGTPA